MGTAHTTIDRNDATVCKNVKNVKNVKNDRNEKNQDEKNSYEYQDDPNAQSFAIVVKNLLDSKEWQGLSGMKCQDILQKLQLADHIGAPPMTVLSAETLRTKGYIPRSDEKDATILVQDVLQEPNNSAVLIFLSHRWLQTDHPDNTTDPMKYRALIHWSDWYENVYCQSSNSRRKVYFWIDWSCLDQDLIQQNKDVRGVLSLPLYKTTTGNKTSMGKLDNKPIPTTTTNDAISTSISSSTIKQHVYYKTNEWVLHDPRTGKLFESTDRKFIESLTECALTSNAWTGGDGRLLEFGKSTVMAQVMYCSSTKDNKTQGL